MATFYVTFGQKYLREEHPYFSAAHPDGWLEVEAEGYIEAVTMVQENLQQKYSSIYSEESWDPSFFPGGKIGTITEQGITS